MLTRMCMCVVCSPLILILDGLYVYIYVYSPLTPPRCPRWLWWYRVLQDHHPLSFPSPLLPCFTDTSQHIPPSHTGRVINSGVKDKNPEMSFLPEEAGAQKAPTADDGDNSHRDNNNNNNSPEDSAVPVYIEDGRVK